MKVPKGIRIQDLKIGTGAVAEKGKVAVIHYDCFLPRGDKCDTSRNQPLPIQFEVGQRQQFPALEYGVVGMAVGGVRSITASPNLTYYEHRLKPDLPQNATLRYVIELIRVSDGWDNSLYRPSKSLWSRVLRRFSLLRRRLDV